MEQMEWRRILYIYIYEKWKLGGYRQIKMEHQLNIYYYY